MLALYHAARSRSSGIAQLIELRWGAIGFLVSATIMILSHIAEIAPAVTGVHLA